MESQEVRLVLVEDNLFATVNSLLSGELQIHGTPLGNGYTAISLLEFMYSYTYTDAESFNIVYDAFVASTVISSVPTSGIVIEIEDDASLTFHGLDVDLSTHEAGSFILDGEFYTHDDVRESVVISDALAQIDLSQLSNVTPQLLAAFDAINIQSYTQVAYLNYQQWLGLGGVDDYDVYQALILEAMAASVDFWETL